MSVSSMASTTAPLTSSANRTPISLLFGAARSVRLEIVVVHAIGKLAPRSGSVGTPEASFLTN